MADAKEEVLAQEVNEIFNMEQMFDNIKVMLYTVSVSVFKTVFFQNTRRFSAYNIMRKFYTSLLSIGLNIFY